MVLVEFLCTVDSVKTQLKYIIFKLYQGKKFIKNGNFFFKKNIGLKILKQISMILNRFFFTIDGIPEDLTINDNFF